MDEHAKTIAVAEPEGTVRSVGSIANEPKAVRKLIEKLGSEGRAWRVCYEAGPTGYVIYWPLTRMGVACEAIAPTLIPVKPGDRVKTDRRDAEKLALSGRRSMRPTKSGKPTYSPGSWRSARKPSIVSSNASPD